MTLMIISFPLALVAGLSFHGLHWDRWMIPVLPFLAIGAGVALMWLWRQPTVPRWVTMLLLIVTFMPPIFRGLATTRSFRTPETRELARQWFIDHTFESSTTVAEAYTPRLLTDTTKQSFTENIGLKRDLDYQADGVDYFVTNADRRELFLSLPTTFPVFITYYQNTLAQSQLLYRSIVPAAESMETRVSVPDWTIWRHPWPFSVRRGQTIEIYGFSERAKAFSLGK